MENGVVSTKGEGFLSRMALNDNKAGMEGLDRDKINKIIMESSKGSRFYENELKREQQVNQRIEKMMLQKAQITDQQLKTAQAQVDRMASTLERSRDLSRAIVHVDMDAFYAAVEMRDCPELKDKPMAVGSMSMLSTSNYHARKYGCRAAMPGFIAKKLCPNLVIVPTNFDKYRAVSEEIREIFADYDPHFQPMSLDEAYLDFTDHLDQRQSWPDSSRTHRFRTTNTSTGEDQIEFHREATPETKDLSPVLFEDSPSSSPCLPGSDAAAGGSGAFEVFGTSVEEAVREMRFRIEQKTMLTASAGIAPNMMLAKVCSDKNKPNGQYRLPSTRAAVMDFIQNLPIRKVSGVGKVSEKMLNALGVSSCSHLGQQMALLSLLFSETAWHHFLQVSMGLGSTYIPRHEERKSMSTERTFRELNTAEEQFSLCRELCEDLAEDMKKEDLKGKTVTLKLKNVKFEVKTRALTLPYAVATADDIFAVAKDLLKTEIENEIPQPLRLRLMGVRISAFVTSDDKKPQQRSIISFLQPGKTDSDGSTKVKQQKPEREHVSSRSVQTCPLVCSTLTQKQEDVPWQSKKSGLEGGQTGEDPQLSFFQRAHAKRLQLQVTSSSTQVEGPRENPSVITSIESDGENIVESSTHAFMSNDSDHAEKDSEAKASTSGCGASASKSFTCPVCFRQVETTDLNAFNRHIDQCLSGSSTKQNQSTDSESDSDLESDHKEREVKETWKEECEVREVEVNTVDLQHQSSKDDSIQTVLSNNDNKTVTSQQPQLCSVLICPVCQLTQDTDDLTVFNRHVDLCLNQEVLNELGGRTSSPINPPSVTNGKATERGQLLPRQASKGKSKRQDCPSSPPSKRAKGSGPVNTIDKFFR
ncbi:DNA polymerase kappa [Paralichthys olivaceus]|uniref:DNA polymerase kappa n=1 Tax=Paralichthys olivaceus TaxID=8255 RepID=UPI00097D78D1|nr:PREDICTED: DNA polymerase kappa [Paralichthys olivaceus]XP_019956493.1 PREDICTED: DNA polymerase kappa [Paralichthys olivaceus]